MTAEPVDVVIIGGGVSGAVVAKRLVEAGIPVLCLEQGDWPDPTQYPGASAEWELRSATQWSSVPALRNAPGDYPVDLTSSDLGVLNYNGVGGGSVLYSAQWPRMLPDDFAVRSLDGVADDWPIGYGDLQAYYEQTDRDFGVSGLGGNPMYPPGEDPPLPPLPIGAIGLRVARAHARLGWHWWVEPNAIASAPFDGRNPCVQRGSCGSGCNEGAKASTDRTHWPKVAALGGRVVTGARVRRIDVDRRGLACGVEWVDRQGRGRYQEANLVVCAANAIGTARLLLASSSRRHPAGMGNSSGLVGRNLMLHPLATVAGLFDGPCAGWRAHAGGLVQSLQFARSDPDRGFVRGAKWALGTAGGPLRAAFAPDGVGCWGLDHHRHVQRHLGRSGRWTIIAEDLPEPQNRVELSRDLVDDAGIPAPRVVYRLGANTERLICWQIERARESLQEAGATEIEVVRHRANGHFMGTARMGIDPSASVVDPSCIAHDVPNLVIPDGSVFVTAGSANPTSTIAAIALRAADLLLARRSDVELPEHRRSFAGLASRDGTLGQGGSAPPGVTVAIRKSAPRTRTEELVPPPSAQQRGLIKAAADLLIPAGEGMPAAGAIVADGPVDRVLSARPDLVPKLAESLVSFEQLCHRRDEVGNVRRDARFGALRYVVAAAYYLDQRVRTSLGYDPERVAPVRGLEFPEYLEEGLLDHMLEGTT